jgi:hypothetical protein
LDPTTPKAKLSLREWERNARVATTAPLVIAAFAGSFHHVQQVAAEHGQAGWMSWAIASSVELMAAASGLEIRARKQGALPYKWPVATLLLGVAMSIGANLGTAERSYWGVVMAVWPAVAWMSVAGMFETRRVRGGRRAVRINPRGDSVSRSRTAASPAAATPTPKPAASEESVTGSSGRRAAERAAREAVERDLVAAMRAVDGKYRPNYEQLMERTGRSKSWCEKRVQVARRALGAGSEQPAPSEEAPRERELEDVAA